MKQKKIIWVFIVIAIFLLGALAAGYFLQTRKASIPLTDHNGKEIDFWKIPGETKVIYFGFTNCIDVCPRAVSQLTQAISILGADGTAVVPIFVTVDPNRDTPDVLHEYLSNFKAPWVGVTGEEKELEKLRAEFGVMSKKMEEKNAKDGINYDHTIWFYVLNSQNILVGTVTSGSTPMALAKYLRGLL